MNNKYYKIEKMVTARRVVDANDLLGFGGYMVPDDDGRYVWLPEKTFKDNYRPVTAMNFGQALHAMRTGMSVSRAGWVNDGVWLKMYEPSPTSLITAPYVVMKTADEQYVPWECGAADMLADDWQAIDEDWSSVEEDRVPDHALDAQTWPQNVFKTTREYVEERKEMIRRGQDSRKELMDKLKSPHSPLSEESLSRTRINRLKK